MMTTRFPRIKRSVRGIGTVRITSGAKNARQHQQRVVLFDQLIEADQIEVIRSLLSGELEWSQLVEHRREKGTFGAGVLTEVKTRVALDIAVKQTLPKMGESQKTRMRYAVTWKRLATLIGTAKVADLASVDFPALRKQWGRSPSDWNHVGRFLSAFLTKYVGLHHPLRATVVAAFPRRKERPRVPDLSIGLFWAIVEKAPTHVQPSFVTLLLTGLRVNEYLALRRHHLMPHTHRVTVPGTKTDESDAPISIEAEHWHWVDKGVPSRVQYRWLRMHWCRACVAAGAATWNAEKKNKYRGLTLNSLRHALAQLTSDAGANVFDVKAALRHTNLSTSEGYARRSGTAKVAGVIGRLLRKETA